MQPAGNVFRNRLPDKGGLARRGPPAVQQWVILPLGHDEPIVFQILIHHEKTAPVAPAANAQAPALAQGVVHQPVVAPYLLALRSHHISGLGGQKALQERLEIPLANKRQHCRCNLFSRSTGSPASGHICRTCGLVSPPTGKSDFSNCAL